MAAVGSEAHNVEIIKKLSSRDVYERLSTLQSLKIIHNEELTEAVINCLYDWCREVRIAAALALEGTTHPDAIKALYEGLRDTDREFRLACLRSAPPVAGDRAA